MAVVREKGSVAMLLSVESGVKPDGSAKYSNITLNRVNPAATDDDIFACATALGALQAFPVVSVSVRTVDVLSNE